MRVVEALVGRGNALLGDPESLRRCEDGRRAAVRDDREVDVAADVEVEGVQVRSSLSGGSGGDA
jgi:hypothetical protein